MKSPKKNRKCFLRRTTNFTFSKFSGWRRKKNRAPHVFLKLRSARSFETALNAGFIIQLINELIRDQRI